MIGIMVAMLSITVYISFPIPFTPILITAQTIVINLIGLILKPKQSITAVLVFLLVGSIGIPVFSGGRAGVGTLVGPSGGYFVGFLISVFAMSYLRGNKIDFKRYLLVTIVIGMPIIYFFAAMWMSYYNGTTIIETIKIAVIPFIAGDIIKGFIASIIAVRLNKVYGNK